MVRKLIYFTLITAAFGLFLIGCNEENEGIIETPIVDVSARITNMPAVTGAGAVLSIGGTQLDNVERIIFGLYVVRKIEIESTETGIKFNVPAQVALGMNDVTFVFPGAERAFDSILVIPRQTISWFNPTFGFTDTVVTVYGTNLDIVTSVGIGDVPATIMEQSKQVLKFAVPDGATTDVIKTESDAGLSISSNMFIACPDTTEYLCLPILNDNGDFEQGTVGVIDVDGNSGPNWWLAGSGTRTQYEIINAPANYPDLGTKTLKATMLVVGDNDYSNQVVNENVACQPGRKFRYMGKIWSDATGRRVKIVGGVSLPGYSDMLGDTTLTLNQGWNEFATTIWHDVSKNQDETQMRLQANFGYAENDGAIFMFDSFRVVDIGPRDE